MIVQEEETTQTNRSRVEDVTLEYPQLSLSSADGAATLTQVQTSTPVMVSQPQLQQKIVCLENKDWLYSGELSTVEEATALISLMK